MTRLRSVLYMPASNPRAVAKARELPCDAVILDLEDAVAPDAKAAARAQAAAAVRDGGFGKPVVVRINGRGTAWGDDDLAALAGGAAEAVLVPKVDGPADLRWARERLAGVPLWAMTESCAGVIALSETVGAAGELGLTALVAGTNDLAKEMRSRPDAARTPLLPVLTQIVVAARAAGIATLDGVCNALGDADRLAAECAQGAMLGFDGKTLIHPDQIAAANAAFAPTAADIAWASGVLKAFAQPENADKGAIRFDGAMVERLHLAEAERILAAG
ncbi:HpcH/HpaI aldolase/citrate lyase family protein [Sphingomonas sp.]|uniref:HpcH/HpaI aldolase/citrate lyase family protein n=1 Tax=Sphingomonas sp. TaxID=28214 RepID=UPI003CC501CB